VLEVISYKQEEKKISEKHRAKKLISASAHIEGTDLILQELKKMCLSLEGCVEKCTF
jgi:hypothetical protein